MSTIYGRRVRVITALLAVLFSSRLEIITLALPSGSQPAPGIDSKKNHPEESRDDSRPRRAERAAPAHPDSDGRSGPLIRIGLMTDVASISLTSNAGLLVRRLSEEEGDASKEAASGRLRAELRKQTEASPPRQTVFRVEVASLWDSREAEKLSDDLKKRSFGPISVSYDAETAAHRVLVGQFETLPQAEPVVERLARAGYPKAFVTSEEIAPARPKDPRWRAVNTGKAAPVQPAEKVMPALAAFEADRLIASSKATLIIAPAEPPASAGRAASASKPDTYRAQNSSKREERKSESATARPVEKRPASLRVGNTEYRGEIHLVLNPRGSMNVVNVLPLEEYLRGVVPMELSPGQFPQIEALKAQAIAARTYALSGRGRFNGEGFDLRDDARSQVYGGLTAEQALTDRAVEETRGMVALYKNAEGRYTPIEALYTSTCGGRTENNESVFLTSPLPYLRSVECAPEKDAIAAGREMTTGLSVGSLLTRDGRSAARDVALAEVMGFALPRHVTAQYLQEEVNQSEVRSWVERAARIARHDKPDLNGSQITRWPAFAPLFASAIYGQGRHSLLMSDSDINYLLAGFDADGRAGDSLPREARADLAQLLQDGILRLPPGGLRALRSAVTRAQAIEMLARAFSKKFDVAGTRLENAIAAPAADNRLVIASGPKASEARAQGPGAASTFELERDAWLFRRFGTESYPVERLALLGGERVTYHVNGAGRVDFLEAEPAERGAASDRYSSHAHWQERLSAEAVQQRLSRSRVDVGKIKDLTPVSFGASNRVVTLLVTGTTGQAELRGSKIRNALGLKENLFVIERERDADGQVKAFTFTGRGWGHGVGMCQTGAYGLAREGYSGTAILQKYYTGVKVQKVY